MRTSLTRRVLAAVVFLGLSGLWAGAGFVAAQEKAESRSRGPRKGDTIVVKGCLAGSTLQSTESQAQDGTTLLAPAYTYQLKGKKALLKELRTKHEGSLVEITGELKSTLPDESFLGTKIGRTKIVLGGEPMSREQAMQGTGQPQPVLEVKSYEGTMVSCRR
jgi:hypothetical protein